LEASVTKTQTFYDEKKYKSQGIFEHPSIYAKNSISCQIIKGAVVAGIVIGLAVLAAPVVSFAASVLPVVGVAGLIGGMTYTFMASAAAIFIASAGASIYFSHQTITGLKYEVRCKDDQKNRSHILFKNRYCDDKPLRNEEETRNNPRRSDKSRGKKGENSKKKSEDEKDDHGKSSQFINEFETDAHNLDKKSKDLRKDNQKEQAASTLNAAAEQVGKEAKIVENTLNEVVTRVDQLSNEIESMNSQIEQISKKKEELMQKIASINSILNSKEESLSNEENELLNNVDNYLNSMENQLEARVKLEFIRIRENGTIEVQQKLKQQFLLLKTEIEQKCRDCSDEQMNIKNEINSKKREKTEKQAELEALRNQKFESIKKKVNSEQELSALNEMQSRIKEEASKENKMEEIEQVMIMKEFNFYSMNQDDDKVGELAQINYAVSDFKLSNIKQNLNEEEYKKLFPKGVKVQPLSELLKEIIKFSNEFKQDINLSISKLDFVLHVMKSDKINEEIKGILILENKEKEADLFEIKHIFKNIKDKPIQLDSYFYDMTEQYFKKPRKALTLLTYNEETELFFDSINFLKTCCLRFSYQFKDHEEKKSKNQKIQVNFLLS
jgi:hypothetical protein